MTEKNLKKIQCGELTWIDIENPTLADLTELKDEYKFHDLDVEDCLSENQRPKVDEYDDYLFVILHIPYFDKKRQHITEEEVDIFIKNNLLITVHWDNLKPLTDMFESCEKKETVRKEFMGLSSGYLLYEIVDQLFTSAFPILDAIETGVSNLEKTAFFSDQQRDMLKDILNVKKNIIIFRRIITPERTVIAQIEHKNKKFLPDTLEVYFDDILDKVEKIWSRLENLKELIESLQDTNESIISHATNDVIKTLTVFNVVMLPLNLVAGLYGMNVNLPLATHEYMFFILIGVMLGILGGMLIFFKFKRWI